MAKFVLVSEVITIDGNDLSDYCNKAEFSAEVDEKVITTFGSNGWEELLGGIKKGSLALEFKQDFAASALDSIMWALLGSVVTFTIKPTDSATGTSNPEYQGSVLIKGWNPIQGGVGDEASVSVTFPTSGAVVRATA